LILVRHKPWFHPVDFEFVFNRADIDSAQVVWARELEATDNRALIDYFADRTVWLLEAEAEIPMLVPYPVETLGGRDPAQHSSISKIRR
jgi:hypothetical protein